MSAPGSAYLWIDINAKPYRDDDGTVKGMVAAIRDIDDQVAAETELERLARSDVMTGLANRAEGLRLLDAVKDEQRNPGSHVVALFCDIDHFKDVNDTYGHAAGDDVLRALAQRLTSAVRRNDIVTRLGGDEFLIVLTGVHDVSEAIDKAEQIRIAAAEPIDVDAAGTQVRTSLSIGVAVAHPDEDIDHLILRADAAMYIAKKQGRNQVTWIKADDTAEHPTGDPV